jgi:CAAX protease family protein
VIVLVLTALLTIVPLVPVLALPAGIAIVVLTVFAWRRHDKPGTSLGLFSAACVVLSAFGVRPQQVVFPIAFTVYFVVVWRVAWLRRASAWARRGALDAAILGLVAAIVIVSALAVVAWYVIVQPDLGDLVRTFVPNQALWVLAPSTIVLAMVNAAIEEAAYRGVLLSALDATLGPGLAPLVLQAIAFGALHLYGGFPRGASGAVLAFVYGLLLGALRGKAGGLLAPWIAHVLTDLVIFSVVIALARA